MSVTDQVPVPDDHHRTTHVGTTAGEGCGFLVFPARASPETSRARQSVQECRDHGGQGGRSLTSPCPRTLRGEMNTRRFPPPWRADKTPHGYVVRVPRASRCRRLGQQPADLRAARLSARRAGYVGDDEQSHAAHEPSQQQRIDPGHWLFSCRPNSPADCEFDWRSPGAGGPGVRAGGTGG